MAPDLMKTRSSGILLHPTSLPGPFGVGAIGDHAVAWIDFLAASGTRLWQVLPLGPTGYGDSPYQCFSSFAGNPLLISVGRLIEAGLLDESETAGPPQTRRDRIDYGAVIPFKSALLDRAYRRAREIDPSGMADEFAEFRATQAHWLDDFALFMALKEQHGGGPWTEWSRPLRLREAGAMEEARAALADDIDRHAFRQFLFFGQWSAVRDHARDRGVAIVGDIPIFVAPDSADVWANQDLFRLDEDGLPTVVAGVPPDYFSDTGQLWGNPLYDWDRHAADGFAWWIDRIRATLEFVDIARIDHFRGFADYWEIPAGSPTAVTGRWLDGPGAAFFKAVRKSLGDLPIIAEDLGELSAKVPKLRDRFDLPGMKILQFAFDEKEQSDFLPHKYPENCVVYTGTHDNNTTRGWWTAASARERAYATEYLGLDVDGDIVRQFIQAAWASRAVFAVAPIQDFLGLGPKARMNTPGTRAGNWRWRLKPGLASPALAAEIRLLNQDYGRLNAAASP